ncbi:MULTISPECIES: hypothetical protein [Enterobacter cloacae complex]|uniref:hypothetical protein n=1 Tax=Enterobacter cloacae complex TaxID=354276 RepID=UPI001D0391BE|nr:MULTISPECIES: hypothetical protein [Enterobacter cloacae complex]
MATGEEKSKTTVQGSGSVVKGKCEPECYLHPGSATLLFLTASENKVIEQEHNFLAGLLEAQKQAQKNLDDINYEAITQAGRVPARKFESEITNAYAALDKANKALRQELMSLTANPPEGELLNDKMKDTAIGIMELIPLKKNTVKGVKKVYVRSDKIKQHWRTYRLSEVDKKSGEASFIKYKNKTITTQDADGKTVEKTIRQAKIDTEKLIKQFNTVPASLRCELVKDTNVIVSSWAEEMNKSLTWPKGNDKVDESVYHKYVDISAQAQLMRYSHGAGLSAKYNPSEGKLEGKIEGHASFALGEAKAEAVLYLPDRLGISLLFPAKEVTKQIPDGVCNMGALRFAMKLVLSGSVGASAAIEVGVKVDWRGEMGKGYGIKGRPATLTAPPLPGQQQVNLKTPNIPDAQGGGEIGVFVGAQAGGNISGAIEWFDPHPDETPAEPAEKGLEKGDKPIVNKENKFATIAKLEAGMTVQAGAGGSGVFYITYIQGRFRIYCKAAFCWGVGAKGEVGFEVDGSSFAAFMKSFLYMLRNVDYQKLELMMEGDAFRSLCAIPIIMAAQGIQAGEAMLKNMVVILQQIRADLKDENKRVNLMDSILSNPDQLKYTPPETKGAVIATLIDQNWADWLDPRNQNNDFFSVNSWKLGPLKKRKQAVFMALKWVQSQADYNNVMQHLTLSPGEKKGSKELNEKDVINFLGIGEHKLFFYTNYGEKLTLLHNNLPTTVDPDEPFKPIPDILMSEYLAMVDEQHPTNTMIA